MSELNLSGKWRADWRLKSPILGGPVRDPSTQSTLCNPVAPHLRQLPAVRQTRAASRAPRAPIAARHDKRALNAVSPASHFYATRFPRFCRAAMSSPPTAEDEKRVALILASAAEPAARQAANAALAPTRSMIDSCCKDVASFEAAYAAHAARKAEADASAAAAARAAPAAAAAVAAAETPPSKTRD